MISRDASCNAEKQRGTTRPRQPTHTFREAAKIAAENFRGAGPVERGDACDERFRVRGCLSSEAHPSWGPYSISSPRFSSKTLSANARTTWNIKEMKIRKCRACGGVRPEAAAPGPARKHRARSSLVAHEDAGFEHQRGLSLCAGAVRRKIHAESAAGIFRESGPGGTFFARAFPRPLRGTCARGG